MSERGEPASGRRARQLSERSLERNRGGAESRVTVLFALVANIVVALVKLAGGLLSGSTALLAEAAHSTADSVNQVFLLISIELGKKAPTEQQPFGFGQQRFLWTFMAAIGMFVAGALFAIGYGTYELLEGGEPPGGFGIAWITLAVAGVAEGISWVRAIKQTRAEAAEAGKPLLRYTSDSRDPSVKLVLFEDTVAMIGMLFAAIGIGFDQLTGSALGDPIASICIGLLLVFVAVWMARDTGRLLVGAAALPEERATMERVMEEHGDVVEVLELLTMAIGPNALLVAARVDLRDDVDGARAESASTEIDHALREAVPDVTEVFIDATPGRGRASAQGA